MGLLHPCAHKGQRLGDGQGAVQTILVGQEVDRRARHALRHGFFERGKVAAPVGRNCHSFRPAPSFPGTIRTEQRLRILVGSTDQWSLAPLATERRGARVVPAADGAFAAVGLRAQRYRTGFDDGALNRHDVAVGGRLRQALAAMEAKAGVDGYFFGTTGATGNDVLLASRMCLLTGVRRNFGRTDRPPAPAGRIERTS